MPRLIFVFGVAFALLARDAAAGEVELSAYLGRVVPVYDQTFSYDPGSVVSPIPGLNLLQSGEFSLEGRSGLALGGAVTLYLSRVIGFEARIDTVDADAEITGARYDVTATLPAPFPPLMTTLDLGSGRAELARLRPLSLNLKLRTPGPVRLTLSGGVSYLPRFDLEVTQTVGLGATALVGTNVNVATLALRARALPEADDGRIGANAGAGLQLALSHNVALVGEARGFIFPKHRLEWSPTSTGPRSQLEQQLLDEVLQRLEPIDFNPTFVQAMVGIAITF